MMNTCRFASDKICTRGKGPSVLGLIQTRSCHGRDSMRLNAREAACVFERAFQSFRWVDHRSLHRVTLWNNPKISLRCTLIQCHFSARAIGMDVAEGMGYAIRESFLIDEWKNEWTTEHRSLEKQSETSKTGVHKQGLINKISVAIIREKMDGGWFVLGRRVIEYWTVKRHTQRFIVFRTEEVINFREWSIGRSI